MDENAGCHAGVLYQVCCMQTWTYFELDSGKVIVCVPCIMSECRICMACENMLECVYAVMHVHCLHAILQVICSIFKDFSGLSRLAAGLSVYSERLVNDNQAQTAPVPEHCTCQCTGKAMCMFSHQTGLSHDCSGMGTNQKKRSRSLAEAGRTALYHLRMLLACLPFSSCLAR